MARHGAGDAGQAAPRGSRGGRAIAAGATLVLLSIVYGFATFLVMADLTPITPSHDVVVWALFGNGILALGLITLIGWELSKLFAARRQRVAGARLHARIVGLFALAAAVPAVLMASAASVTLDRGFDSMFSASTQQAYATSVGLAETYMRETNASLRGDLLQIAFVLNGLGNLIATDKARFDEVVESQAQLSGLDGIYVIDRARDVITKVVAVPDDRFVVPTDADMDEADTGRPVLKPVNEQREISALIRIPAIENAYLFIARRLDPAVLGRLQAAADEALRHSEMQSRRLGMQLALTLMYAAIGLILVFSAIWMGFWLANRLVAPIRRLIGAAEQVSRGQLEVTVPVKPSEGELANLGMTFNDMTKQLRSQHGALIDANAMLDTRRRFTEAVLAGVTAGVIGLDPDGTVTLVNRSGESILARDTDALVGRRLAEVVPELEPLLGESIGRARRRAEGQITLRQAGGERTVIVRVTSEGAARGQGYVVTMDDITELVVAQRTSAWADVARRIAHEIKNPLTPIQLSAERLRRKYGKVIVEDREVFEQCTGTIIRQVGDIGRMVDEFSSFARMPKAVMGEHDIVEILRQSTFLISVAHPDIVFDLEVGDEPVPVQCDRRLLSQAITNLVKNATESFASAVLEEGEEKRIRVLLEMRDDGAGYVIRIIDNGVGFPQENRNRLLEPYMTTREKGTGLGLAIVQKIIEEHGGRMSLEDAPEVAEGGHGAMVLIEMPMRLPADETEKDGAGRDGAPATDGGNRAGGTGRDAAGAAAASPA